MTKIYVTFHHDDSGLCRETFKEVFRIVDDVKIYPKSAKYFNLLTTTKTWYTVYPCKGWWECSSEVKKEYIFTICDKKGETIYFENSKDYISINEKLKLISKEFVQKYNLNEYEKWKSLLLNTIEFKNSNEYRDNWLYCMLEETEAKVTICKFEYLGFKYELIKEFYRHSVCNIKWEEYVISDGDSAFTVGYKKVKKEKQNERKS